jgi:hypothetical protein
MIKLPTYTDLGPDPEPLGVRADLLINRPRDRVQPIRSSPHSKRGFRPMKTNGHRHTVKT